MINHDWQNYPELTNSQLQELEFESPFPQIKEDFQAQVVKVHDGDTITLRTGFRDFDFPLRFLNIDAPELNEGGETAREWLKQEIEGKEVEIRMNEANRVDKWGRLLGSVFHNGMDIGEAEMHLGLAKPYGTIKEGEVPTAEQSLGSSAWR